MTWRTDDISPCSFENPDYEQPDFIQTYICVLVQTPALTQDQESGRMKEA